MARSHDLEPVRQTAQWAWPVDENGKPMALVGMQASELIGLPNFSNVTIGPAVVMRYVPDTDQDRRDGLKACAQEVESVVGEERELLYTAMKAKAAQQQQS